MLVHHFRLRLVLLWLNQAARHEHRRRPQPTSAAMAVPLIQIVDLQRPDSETTVMKKWHVRNVSQFVHIAEGLLGLRIQQRLHLSQRQQLLRMRAPRVLASQISDFKTPRMLDNPTSR